MSRNKQHKSFWNKEYKKPTHLAISTEPSGDLEKFTRWQERNFGRQFLNPHAFILDLGCGNGRNLIFLARNYGCRGAGYDISKEAIAQAKSGAGGKALVGNDKQVGVVVDDRSARARLAPEKHYRLKTLPPAPVLPALENVKFEVRSLDKPLHLADNSVSLVLDMMSSHILKLKEREQLRDEIWRVLRPGGWFFFKSFLLEEDLNAMRMIHDYPAISEGSEAAEPHAYIHPTLGVYEHVWTIDELDDFFGLQFEIHKIEKSHKHMSHGRAFRRRTVTLYLQKRD